jgi:hypothetical protein
MLATILVHVPLAIAPLLQPAFPPECQLDVLTPVAIEERALTEFNANIDEYLALQRRLARALEMFDDEDPFFADELRSALVAARPGARPGSVFTPRVADAVRQRIDIALAYAGGSAIPFSHDAMMISGRARVNEPLHIVPDPFAWTSLIRALPPLPAQLGYTVLGGDLVLVDVAANLVIDVLAEAVPAWPGPDVIYR